MMLLFVFLWQFEILQQKNTQHMAQIVQCIAGIGVDAITNTALLIAGTVAASFSIPTLVGLRFLTAVRRRLATHKNPRGTVVIVTGAARKRWVCLRV